MGITTTDSMKSRPFRCDVCRQETVILVPREDRRQVCLDCLPADQQAVFRAPSVTSDSVAVEDGSE